MAQTVIERFDESRVTEFNLMFESDEQATKFGVVGQLQGETTLTTLTLNEEGVMARTKTKPQSMQLTIDAHMQVDSVRRILGISNLGLKPGVYSYGIDSKTENFVLTLKSIDDITDTVKYLAFPVCSTSAGLTINVENGADEVAELELTFDALKDDNGKLYYEAFEDELDDDVKSQWHTNFTPDLVSDSDNGDGDTP